uniref:Uncharacterized protein n=1 Tax=Panagrolaimus davidi TaxID=227884 RepID=A0A914Q2T3_9BILA
MYIPSLIVIRQKKFSSQPCYKIMFYVGIVDVFCLCVNGLATGVFMIKGYVFCSSPVLLHSLGAIGLGLWIAASDVGMILGINRCFEMYNTHVAASFFEGRKVYIWLMIPTIHGFYAWLFSKSVSFSSILLSWFFNPHVGYYGDDDLIVRVWQNVTKTFVQVFFICTFTTIAAAVYVYEQFFPVSNIYILMGSYAWCCAHGFPSIIYVTMNKTVRKQIFGWFKIKNHVIYNTSSVQATSQAINATATVTVNA